MTTPQKIKTPLDRHQIGNFGTIFDLIYDSKIYSKYLVNDSQILTATRKAAEVDEKKSREYMLSLIDTVTSLSEANRELRARFETLEKALTKVNAILIENQETSKQ